LTTIETFSDGYSIIGDSVSLEVTNRLFLYEEGEAPSTENDDLKKDDIEIQDNSFQEPLRVRPYLTKSRPGKLPPSPK
jgi:hypothetical protein